MDVFFLLVFVSSLLVIFTNSPLLDGLPGRLRLRRSELTLLPFFLSFDMKIFFSPYAGRDTFFLVGADEVSTSSPSPITMDRPQDPPPPESRVLFSCLDR